MPDESQWWDATAQAEAVRSGTVSALELADEAISRIERLDPHLEAVIHPRYERAREEAGSDIPDGPFRGVPLLLKDLIAHQAGEPFHEGCRGIASRGYVAGSDTELVRRFRQAGFVVLGKTKTSEFGILPHAEADLYPPARNPWDPSRTTMGSGGGSGAAVGSGMVAIAHSNDMGGSIRLPAGACGAVGLKPTRGRVSLAPAFGDLVGGLVAEFPITRSVRDAAGVLDAVAGPAPGEPYGPPPPARRWAEEPGSDPGSLRIGVFADPPAELSETHPDCRAAVDLAAGLCSRLGHNVESSFPAALQEPELGLHLLGISSAYVEFALQWWGRLLGEPLNEGDVEPLTWFLAELSRGRSPADHLTTVEWFQAFSRRIADWWSAGGFDLLLTPTMAQPPPPLGYFAFTEDNPLDVMLRTARLSPFTMPWNVTGAPAISLPLCWNEEGLPIGVQLVAQPGREDLLLQVSAQLEEAAPWADRHPPEHG